MYLELELDIRLLQMWFSQPNFSFYSDSAPDQYFITYTVGVNIKSEHKNAFSLRYFYWASLHVFIWKIRNQNQNYYMGPDRTKPSSGACAQHRRRPACAPTQYDQCLCYSLFEKCCMLSCNRWNFNVLASLCSWGDLFWNLLCRKPRKQVFSQWGP